MSSPVPDPRPGDAAGGPAHAAWSRVALGLGSNLGDRAALIRGALAALAARADCRLLRVLKDLERAAGRAADGVRNGPRPLDLDILLYGDLRLATDELTIPHPRMHERAFVLEPMRELGLWPRPVAAREGGRPAGGRGAAP